MEKRTLKKFRIKKSYRKPKTRFRIKRKKDFSFKFFFLFSLILGLLVGSFYFIIFSSFFQIKEIKISGNQKISEIEIKKIVLNKIKKKIFFYHTKSIFLTNSKKIEKELSENFPLIEKVILKKDFPETLLIKITERKPFALLCQDEDCYFFDKEGVVFEKGKGDLITVKKRNLKKNLSLGDKVFEKKELKAILEIEKEISGEFKIKIKKMTLENESLTVYVSEGYRIIFDLNKSIQEQLFNLGVVLSKKISTEERKKLEYIDLRFGNRVFFRKKENN